MAREVHDREDLLRDATAFAERLQLDIRLDGQLVEVIVGFRAAGAVSIYFDAEPVYHFNSLLQLRRAYVEGRLIKAEHGKLVRWQPRRSDTSTVMLREELGPEDEQRFGAAMLARLHTLRAEIASQGISRRGAVPPDREAEILGRLANWLGRMTTFCIAASPRVGEPTIGRRAGRNVRES